MKRLINSSQAYNWGSTHAIPEFMGRTADDKPVAEIWMGTHALAPSRFEEPVGLTVPLSDVSGDLPFLMKVLAADKPLSLQVHPGSNLAAAGFRDEEARGIPLDAPERGYKDPNHKPEMVYALTTFETLVGFRPTAEILRVLAPIESKLTKSLAEDLRRDPGFAGIVRLVERLVTEVPSSHQIAEIVATCEGLASSGMDIKRAYVTAVEVARDFPEDVGVIISLLLNRLTLQSGEAAFLAAGVIHAHLSGMCVEVMASSDNVLRAGLTTKHVDPVGLVRCLDKGMSRVSRVTPTQLGPSTDVFSPDVDEFVLSMTQCSNAHPEGTVLPKSNRRIIVCTGGSVTIVNEHGQRENLERGGSVYAGPEDGELRITGLGEVAQAYEPSARPSSSSMVHIV